LGDRKGIQPVKNWVLARSIWKVAIKMERERIIIEMNTYSTLRTEVWFKNKKML